MARRSPIQRFNRGNERLKNIFRHVPQGFLTPQWIPTAWMQKDEGVWEDLKPRGGRVASGIKLGKQSDTLAAVLDRELLRIAGKANDVVPTAIGYWDTVIKETAWYKGPALPHTYGVDSRGGSPGKMQIRVWWDNYRGSSSRAQFRFEIRHALFAEAFGRYLRNL